MKDADALVEDVLINATQFLSVMSTEVLLMVKTVICVENQKDGITPIENVFQIVEKMKNKIMMVIHANVDSDTLEHLLEISVKFNALTLMKSGPKITGVSAEKDVADMEDHVFLVQPTQELLVHHVFAINYITGIHLNTPAIS